MDTKNNKKAENSNDTTHSVSHSNCCILLTKTEIIKVYFKQKRKFGMILTDSKEDAMRFKTKDEATEYNHKFLFGEFKCEDYCG